MDVSALLTEHGLAVVIIFCLFAAISWFAKWFFNNYTANLDTQFTELLREISEVKEEIVNSNSLETESVVEDSSVNEMEKSFTEESMESMKEQTVEESIQEDASNDLKEFGVESDAPDLFNTETENSSSDDLLSSNEEEDELEIPAFLRRQKN